MTEINRKSIFLDNFKSKVAFLFNHKDLQEIEEIIDFYENELKQREEVIEEAIEFCTYLVENNVVEIDNEKYYKHSCDDIITKAILKRLNKYKNENKEA